MRQALSISALEKSAGITAKTLRYWEGTACCQERTELTPGTAFSPPWSSTTLTSS